MSLVPQIKLKRKILIFSTMNKTSQYLAAAKYGLNGKFRKYHSNQFYEETQFTKKKKKKQLTQMAHPTSHGSVYNICMCVCSHFLRIPNPRRFYSHTQPHE